MSVDFVNLWEKLGISNTDFMRTTQERHTKSVKEIIRIVNENGRHTRAGVLGEILRFEETLYLKIA